jgi:hypothetical protein
LNRITENAQKRRKYLAALLFINIPYFLFVAVHTFSGGASFAGGWAFLREPLVLILVLHISIAFVSLYLATRITQEFKASCANMSPPVYHLLLIGIWSTVCFSMLPLNYILLFLFTAIANFW